MKLIDDEMVPESNRASPESVRPAGNPPAAQPEAPLNSSKEPEFEAPTTELTKQMYDEGFGGT